MDKEGNHTDKDKTFPTKNPQDLKPPVKDKSPSVVPNIAKDLPPEAQEAISAVANPIIQALDDEGMNLTDRIKHLVKLTKAKEKKIIKIKGGVKRNKEGEPILEYIDKKGKTRKRKFKIVTEGKDEDIVSVDVKALQIQHEALRDCFKLAGDFPADRTKLELPEDLTLIYNTPKEEDVKVIPDD